MSKPTPRLNPAAFASVAVSQPDPVKSVVAPEAPVPAPSVPTGAALKAGSKAKHHKPGREGRVQVMGWFPAETRLALKRIALESNKTLEQVMGEAFAHYIANNK